jgi:acyl-coenzyme A synthetase/AMP-(fatty) acid ligase
MNQLPLMQRPMTDPLAWRAHEAVSAGRFLYQATALAERLPRSRHVINLSQDRYLFSLAFAAAIIAGRTTLLPANRLPATIDGLLERYPGSLIISDQAIDGLVQPLIDPGQVADLAGECAGAPLIPADLLAAIVFTSGSTGPSSSIHKPWRTLHDSSLINAAEYGPGQTLTHALATVPPQHMWGLETSVLLPWFAPLVMATGQPFFAADILERLGQLARPRALISTPVHLRTLAESGLEGVAIDRIYSATAPLGSALAARLESGTGAEVIEVYGCSEAGCLARRRAAADEPWQAFEAFRLVQQQQHCQAQAAHLPEPVTLFDRLLFEPDGRFRLAGRDSDLVNIAGKRASLADLTQTLLDIPGVIDGIIFQPATHSAGPVARLAALVVAPGMQPAGIRQLLSQRIDPAFMPRPLRLVAALPRVESGKLPRQNLDQFFRQACEPTG